MSNEIKIVVTAENKTAAGVAAAKATVRELTSGTPDTIPIRIGVDGAERARAEIRSVTAEAREVPASETTTVHADTGAADTALAGFRVRMAQATTPQIAKLTVDIAQAEARLTELRERLRNATGDERVKLELETAAADVKLVEMRAKLHSLRNEKLKADLDATSVFSKIGEIASGLGQLRSPVMIPVAISGAMEVVSWIGSVAAGLASLGAVGVSAGAVTAAAFSGIGDAVTGMGQKAAAGGASAAASAATVRNATRGVESAQRDLRDSYDQVASAAHNVESAHLGVAAAERGVEDAAYNLAAAQRGVQDAQARVQDAEWAYGAALRAEANAQQGVADARQQAARALQDLQQQTEDMALSQEDASLAVEEAQARAVKVASDPMATELEKKRADLSVRMAQQRAKDLTTTAQRLAEDKAAADAKGVEGSDLVVAAQQRLTDAQHQVEVSARGISDAQQGVADAEHRVVQAQQALADAQQRVKDAQYAAAQADKELAKAREGVTLATQKLADAQLALKEAQAKTGGGGGGGVDKGNEAFEKLSLQGQRFALFVKDLIDGPIKKLRDISQEEMLPGLMNGMDGFFSQLKNADENVAGIARNVGAFFEQIGPSLGRATDAFLRLGKIGSDTALPSLADAVSRILDRFAAWANSQSPQKIAADIKKIGDTIHELWDTGVLAFRGLQLAWEFLNFSTDAFIDPIHAVEDLYDAIRNFVNAIPGLSGVMPELKTRLSDFTSASDNSASSARGLDSAMQGLNRTAQDTTGAFRSSEEAQIAYEGALARARESVKQNGATMDIHTAKGRENRQAFLDLVDAANRDIEAMQNSNAPISQVTATHEAQRQKLINVATQMGMTKTKAQEYIDKLLQTPKTVNTDVKVNTAQAMANLQALQNKLAAVNGTLSVTPTTGTKGQGLGVYKSTGGWVDTGTAFGAGPKGTDTVPAWLDPREFVVSAGPAQRYGGLLEAINSGSSSQVLSRVAAGGSARAGSTAAAGGLATAPAGGVATVVLELHSSGSEVDDFLMERIRGAVRVRGGDVQVVLGQGMN